MASHSIKFNKGLFRKHVLSYAWQLPIALAVGGGLIWLGFAGAMYWGWPHVLTVAAVFLGLYPVVAWPFGFTKDLLEYRRIHVKKRTRRPTSDESASSA